MKYEKKFSKNKKKVLITSIDDTCFSKETMEVKQLEYEVVSKEEIYEKINKSEPIDLSDKYIEGFSLDEYREKEQLLKEERVNLISFKAKGTFFDSGACFRLANFGEEDINFSYANFGDGDVNFEGANFGKGNVNFFRATFGERDVNFFLATFGKGDVDFRHATFGKGNVFFLQANFGKGNVSFFHANFGKGNVFFQHATFGKGNVNFFRVTFGEGDVNFFHVTFGKGDINFKGATFGEGDVNFSDATFSEEDVDFSDVTFGKGKTVFLKIKVLGDWDLRNLKEVESISFHRSLIHGTINLTGANIDELILTDTQLTGKIFINSSELNLKDRDNKQNDVINIQKNTSHKEKRDQFRLLKVNFRNLGQYEDEDKAYVQFMYHKIRHEAGLSLGVSILKRIIRFPVFAFKWLVFEQMGLYGTRPSRVALSMIFVWLAFTLGYYNFTHLLETQVISLPSKIGTAMYHSIITFLTIGYGDFYPTGALRFWSGVEGFLGLFLMAYFTVSFVRKVLR